MIFSNTRQVLQAAIIKKFQVMSKSKKSIIFLFSKAVLLQRVGFKTLVKSTYKARNEGNKKPINGEKPLSSKSTNCPSNLMEVPLKLTHKEATT